MSATTSAAATLVDVVAGAEPSSSPGSGASARTGVLVLHGFTGSPVSVRPWALALAEAGYAVELPRLPGHGTTWQDMSNTTWHDWYDEAQAGLLALSQRCDTVFVAGLSMGGTLALRLAERHPDVVAGALLVNPSLVTPDRRLVLLPLLKRLVRSVPGIGSDIKKPGAAENAYPRVPLRALASFLELQALTLDSLAAIECRVLTFRSAEDHVVAPRSGELLRSGVRAGLTAEVLLPDSYHVATLDNDAPTIFAGSIAFVREHLAAATP